MSKVLIKAETTGYKGDGEFWVRIADRNKISVGVIF